LVTWDDVFMLDKNLAAEWGYVVDSINIHEMAHRLRPLGSLSRAFDSLCFTCCPAATSATHLSSATLSTPGSRFDHRTTHTDTH
jgi:hypothetical protein